MNFGENLKLLRKKNNMSQEKLAERLGVSRQSVSKWEVGSAYPEMTNITGLCTIFHCNINDLINENIIDVDSFDEVTKENLVKFKEKQQKNMKIISKIIYICAKIGSIIFSISTVCLIIACIVFPIIAHTFSLDGEKLRILNIEIPYRIEDNILSVDEMSFSLNTSTNVKDFLANHDNLFFVVSLEYFLVCMTVIVALFTMQLYYIYKFYKNVYNQDTPFTIENERLLKKTIIYVLAEMLLGNVSGVLYSIFANIDLGIEIHIIPIVYLMVLVSIWYMFKYGRMIQADSKAKLYGKFEE